MTRASPPALALAAALAAALAPGAARAETWDMPTPYGDATFHTQNVQRFAEEVAEATDGALEITVHSAGSLYPHETIKNAVRSRQVPLGEFLLSRLSNEDPAFGLDSQPFLATSYDDARRLWEAQEPVVAGLLAEQGLLPLFSVAWPAQGLYTNGPVEGVEDLTGLRFRAYNAQLEEFARLAGAAPVQVEEPDLPQAFATGQVEAMMTSPSTGANNSAWDYVSHYTPVNAWLPKNIVVVSQDAFEALEPEVQAAVTEAAEAAEARGWEMSQAEADAKIAELEANGMTVAEPSEALTEGLRGIGEEMLATLEADTSEATRQVLDAYRSAE